jgi:hypothetical protein
MAMKKATKKLKTPKALKQTRPLTAVIKFDLK